MTGPDATLAEARDALRAGATTAVALTEAFLAAIAAAAPLNAFVTLSDRALEQAAAADAARAAGADHDLLGIPVGVKDLFCVKGLATQAGSRILEGFVPPYESHVTQRLWDAGAVCLGKLNMDEFAMGSATDTSVFGACVSPWRRRGDRAAITAGGSSGGSAAAVAAGLCLGALGTDTGGSIRQPAAFCGIVGIKPTYGRCSRWGIVAYASSLDQAGPMAKTVRDAAILLGAIAGPDPRDSTSADVPVPAYEAALSDDLRGLRIGVPAEYREGLGAEMAATWDRAAAMLVDAGAEIVPITLPHTKYALAAYYIIAPAEASSNLARYDGVRYGHRVDPGEGIEAMYAATRAEGFGPEVRRRILVGTYVLSAGYYDAYYLRAQKLRTLIARDFAAAFGTVDAILAPASPVPAWGFGELPDDPVAMYLQDIYTVTVNLAGLPGVSVPVGLSPHGLPLGMQLIGRPWDEGTILNAAQAIETRAGRLAAPEAWWRG